MFRVRFAAAVLIAGLSACVEEPEEQGSLNQAAFVEGTTTYRFGHNSIPNIAFVDGPSDIDRDRWGMLHDGSTYRLYFFQSGSLDTFYQYGYSSDSEQYEWGLDSIDTLQISGAPADASTSDFAMLHDGVTYRLYLKSAIDATVIHQFGFNPQTETYEYGYDSIASIPVIGFPADADLSNWAMAHDGNRFRFYALSASNPSTFYQGAYDEAQQAYVFGFDSIEQLTLEATPSDSETSSFAMVHDGSNYRFYFQAR